MTTIRFTNLKIRNFMSIDKMDIDLSTYSGITFITGKNMDDDSENGVGKTTMGNALWYCLSGEAPDKVKLAQIPHRRSGSKDFSVECEFFVNDQQYSVFRSPKKMVFSIGGDGSQTKTNASTNEDILAAMHVDKLTLYQTLFVSVDGDVSFFDKKSSDKIKYIESVLNLKIFEKLFEDSKKIFNGLKNQRDQIEVSLEYLRKDVARNQSEFDVFTEKKNTRIATHRKEIELTQTKLDKLVLPVYKKMENYSEAKAKLEERTKNNENRLAVLNNNLNRNKKDMDALSKMMNCPTCQKPFDDVHTKKEKIESFKTSIALLEAEKVVLLDQQTKLREQAQKARTYEEKVREEEAVIRNRTSLETSIQTITETISDVEKDTNPFGDIVTSKQKEFDEKFIEFENIKKDCKIYEVLKYVYSPEGVKNHIIKRIINLFNDILKNYLVELNSPFRLSFDEYFEETIVHDGDEVAYGTMSRGEKARVMLAIVFTFRELRRLQTGLSVDTTFYDEIFDIGLCKHGMERCLEILEKQQKSFVITHRSENIDTSRYARIELVKKQGRTSLINYMS